MKILIIHTESTFFAGAQKVLGYFLDALSNEPHEVSIALVAGPRLESIIPKNIERITLPENQKFSIKGFIGQYAKIRTAFKQSKFDIIHGWTARDWELTSLSGILLRRPCVGTLHDHPRANFISSRRRLLMRLIANRGLNQVICVSNAVKHQCLKSKYVESKLLAIQNGIPAIRVCRTRTSTKTLNIGYLGTFSVRKGFLELFSYLDVLWKMGLPDWKMWIGGEAQDEESERVRKTIMTRYSDRPWWNQIVWLGWLNNLDSFFEKIDILAFPSTEFDPFPTVIIEAGMRSVPTLASQVGGVGEMVVNDETGWTYAPKKHDEAIKILASLVQNSSLTPQLGKNAYRKFNHALNSRRMVKDHLKLYCELQSVRKIVRF